VVQTQEAANFFPIALRARLRVIPNPIVRPALLPVRRERRLLAVGRLEAEKGFDLLLRTFAFARGDAPDWKLRIIGEGSARPALLRQAADLGLSEVLELPGLFRNIEGEYAEAGAFVLSSRYEGFPNALCEAMAAGMAIAAFACPGGVREIVQDGINGLLAPPEDVAALAVQLARLLGEESLRLRLGKCAVEVAERFSSERVFEDWTRCLRAAVQP
jgi:glycosyltransferase involved in cell wall biosynthesis